MAPRRTEVPIAKRMPLRKWKSPQCPSLHALRARHEPTDYEPLCALWQVRQAPCSVVRALVVASLSFVVAASSTFFALSSQDCVSFSQESFVPFSGVFLPRASMCSTISLVFFWTSAQSIMSEVRALPTAFCRPALPLTFRMTSEIVGMDDLF